MLCRIRDQPCDCRMWKGPRLHWDELGPFVLAGVGMGLGSSQHIASVDMDEASRVTRMCERSGAKREKCRTGNRIERQAKEKTPLAVCRDAARLRLAELWPVIGRA